MTTRKTSRFPILLALAALVLSSLVTQRAAAAAFVGTGSLNTNRQNHTATLLPSGKVLVAGGVIPDGSNTYLATAELYDPATGTWTATGAMTTSRLGHTATLLLNGKVLVAGGNGGSGNPASAELYDPATGTWTATGSMRAARANHTATLLRNGKVLVAGLAGAANSAELYDPAAGTWTMTGSMPTAVSYQTATLLPNGKVLVAGGTGSGGVYASGAQLYDPGTGVWTATGSLNTPRYWHTATLLPNGKVLVAGGYFSYAYQSSVELYDPASGTWTATNGLATARCSHTATLLPNGKLLVAGGSGWSSTQSAELYDPATGTWGTAGTMTLTRSRHTATLLPGGKLLVAGGNSSSGQAELYDAPAGTWAATGSLNTSRRWHTATFLPNGKVLIAGGDNGNLLSSAELYTPATGTWTATGAMAAGREEHTATLLPGGEVLVAGGSGGGSLSSAELYNPATGMWTATGAMAAGRQQHTATLLRSGKVLVAGASSGGNLLSAELYDPASGTWLATGALNSVRNGHTATLLYNGKVLVAGGFVAGPSTSAELYDPATGAWTATGSMQAARANHTATLLPNGKVLVAGGNYLSSAELYDPALGTWNTISSMTAARTYHKAVLLPNGKVLLVGGGGPGAECYDPATDTWLATGAMTITRLQHTATLLPNGNVLAVGGFNSSASLSSAELYDSGLGFDTSCQPQITTATSPLAPCGSLSLTGSGFRGVSESSGGNSQDSSADYPLVQLRSLENGQSLFLWSTSWQTNAFTSLPIWGFPPGYALATLFVNGIPSTGSVLSVSAPVPTPLTLPPLQKLANGSFQFAFTNSPGALFGVLATTNPALPLRSWTTLGGVTEVAPGQFQFTDPQAASSPQRFYRVFAGDIPFSVSVPPPTAQTEAASSITPTLAMLNSYVNPNGYATTIYWQYGLTTSYGSNSVLWNISTYSGGYGHSVSGLTPNTTYHFRIVASSCGGTSYGSDMTFTTVASEETVNALWKSAADVPVTASGYTATGNTVNFTLNFAPATGTDLMVVQNTGLGFIGGVFDNLAQGQKVALSYGGITYDFVANYYGGSGNDLVLAWANNRAFAWGYNAYGQAGDNTTTQHPLPVAVTATGVLAGKTVVALAGGDFHSLALCSDGTLAAWGGNGFGQLGDSTSTDRHVPVAVNTKSGVSALYGKTVVAIAAGADHSLALCSDGTLAAWGGNGQGALGDNSTTQRNVPVAVNTAAGVSALYGKTVVAIAAGADHSLALCSDGTLAAWGGNGQGALGDNSTTQRNAPVAVNTAAGVSALSGKTVVAIAAGLYHSLAFCSDGTLAAWGFNGLGALGDNSTTQRNAPVAVNTAAGVSALSGKTVTAIAAGYYHSLAFCSDGSLAAWGGNNYGQLGDNSTTDRYVPVVVNTAAGVSALYSKTVVALAGGSYYNLAVCSDGTVAAWGRNDYGQLGDNTLTQRNAPVAVNTTPLAVGQRFTRAASRAFHTLALVAAPLPALELQVRQGAGTLTLQWPTNYAGFIPQASPVPAKTTGWTDLADVPVLSGSNCLLTFPTTNPACFFRLRSP